MELFYIISTNIGTTLLEAAECNFRNTYSLKILFRDIKLNVNKQMQSICKHVKLKDLLM